MCCSSDIFLKKTATQGHKSGTNMYQKEYIEIMVTQACLTSRCPSPPLGSIFRAEHLRSKSNSVSPAQHGDGGILSELSENASFGMYNIDTLHVAKFQVENWRTRLSPLWLV